MSGAAGPAVVDPRPGPAAGPPTGPPSGRPPAGRPPVPWWAAVLAVLGVLVVVALVAGVVGAAVLASGTRTVRGPVEATGVRQVVVQGATGGVRVRTDGAAPGAVTGTSSLTTSWADGTVSATQDGGVLTLTVECPSQAWPRRCDVGYDLLVDPDVDLDVDLAAGGLEAEGVAGDVTASVGAGGVSLRRATSQTVDVAVSTGGASLDFAAPPRSVTASSSVGGLVVTLPDDGTAYDVTSRVSVGEAQVGVTDTPGADRVLDLTASVGGVDVQYAGARQERQARHQAP
ncbi:hypothetical protein [Aquipuribacter sp. SD81]|uniref:hypothetical protein n=1 Tax=Aquipuribacter sp. SD81 TaxID=3127703 RepID=UPI0030172717